MNIDLVLEKMPKSPISESFKTLRTNLQFATANKEIKTIVLTSANPGDGKSSIASNLAISYAQLGKKVVLIDADMRKGVQNKIFGVEKKNGLSNYLSGVYLKPNTEDYDADAQKKDTTIINKTEIKNLFLITAGNVPPNPSELLTSPRMKKLIVTLKEKFDLIIIDAPPANVVTDAVVLSKIVDTVLLVCAYKETRREALAKLKKQFESVNAKIAGVVLNKMKATKDSYYNYYYGEGKR